MKALTIKEAQNLIGKTIKWSAPSGRSNSRYGGIAVIDAVTVARKPLTATTIDGDNINYAFMFYAPIAVNDDICYSDGDRYISYEIV